MTDDFNSWWNDNVFSTNNPYNQNTPAFWAWEGWHAAVAAEREACAEICELMYDYGWLDAKRCAKEIRARGQE